MSKVKKIKPKRPRRRVKVGTKSKKRSRIGRQLLDLLRESQHVIKPTARRFQMHTGLEIINRESPEYLVDKILPEKSLAVLYGESGSGKSFVALDWALSILNGSRWLFHKSKQGEVVYVAAEGSGGLGKRLQAWEERHKEGSAAELFVITDAPQFLAEQDVSALIGALNTLPTPPVLIVVDTLARTLGGGDENSTKDMSTYIHAADRLRAEFNCTVLIVHHTGKDKRLERGSSALRAAADVMIKIAKVKS